MVCFLLDAYSGNLKILAKHVSNPTPPANIAGALSPIKRTLAFILIALGLLCAYSNSFRGPFIFDDISSILENSSIRDFRTAFFPPGDSGLTVSGRPLVNFSLAINYTLGGTRVVGYHVANLVIHVSAALLLFSLVRRLLLLPSISEKLRGSSFELALAVSSIWCLHPLQTESVSYVVQRAESLVGFFYFATLYFFMRALEHPEEKRWSIASVAACFLGMGTKEVMVSAPLVVFLFDRAFISEAFRSAWKARHGIYTGLIASWGFLLVCVLSSGGRGSTAGFGTDVSILRYALTQCYAIALYLKLVFWPHPLVLDYGGPLAADLWEVWPYVFLIVGLIALSIIAFRKHPKAGFLGIAFFSILAPSSSFVPIASQTIAEHRMYLPLAAVVSGLVVGIYQLIGKCSFFLFGSMAVAFAFVTFSRNSDYQSESNLWKQTMESRPQNSRAFYAYGMALEKAKMYVEAKTAFERAIELNPSGKDSKVHYALTLHHTGNTKAAIDLLERTVAERDGRSFSEAYLGYTSLGILLGTVGKQEEGIQNLTKAVELKPAEKEARLALGNFLFTQGRFAEAVDQYAILLAQYPEAVESRCRLGEALLKLGRVDDSIAILQQGLDKGAKSADLLSSLGNSFLNIGRAVDARRRFEEALTVDPAFGPAHLKLGLLLSADGEEQAALVHYEAALASGISDPTLLAVSGGSLLAQGRTAEALVRLQRAAELAPGDTEIKWALANGLLQAKQAADAAKVYEELLKLTKESADLRNRLGIAYHLAGRSDDAIIQFQRALAIDPWNGTAKKAIDELKR